VTPAFTVIGEALVDLVPGRLAGEYRASPGGSPFNVAVGLARLGNQTALMARIADDGFGRLLRRAAEAEDIDLAAAPHAVERTTLAIADVDDSGGVVYDFYLEGTADWQWTAAELRRLPAGTELLHFGSIASWTLPGSERIDELVRDIRSAGGVLISYDPNIRPAVLGARGRAVGLVEQSVRCAHLVKASREDVEWMYPGRGADDVAGRWIELGAALVVLTDGPRGATAYRRGAPPLRRPGREIVVVDTIGAGDAFSAGLLFGLARRGLHAGDRLAELTDAALVDIVDEAVLISAITCERAGADPPRLDELRELADPLTPPAGTASRPTLLTPSTRPNVPE
jgi:fructokinase